MRIRIKLINGGTLNYFKASSCHEHDKDLSIQGDNYIAIIPIDLIISNNMENDIEPATSQGIVPLEQLTEESNVGLPDTTKKSKKARIPKK